MVNTILEIDLLMTMTGVLGAKMQTASIIYYVDGMLQATSHTRFIAGFIVYKEVVGIHSLSQTSEH